MRAVLIALLALGLCSPAAAAEPQAPMSPPADEGQPVQLGGGVVLPRPAFDRIMAQEGGAAVIERMQERAKNQNTFQGLPHLIVIFVSVLVFFLMAMIYYQRKHARLHRTIQLMVEKGMQVPAEILRAAEEAEASHDRSPSVGGAGSAPTWASNLLWGGLLWVTLGIAGGLYLYLRGNDAWPWAMAAVIYGGASVLTAIGKRRSNP
jgi:hypothetical protein